jgi:hypothetical protein
LNSLAELIQAISQINATSEKDPQKKVEDLIDTNYGLLGIGENDTPRDLNAFNGRIRYEQLGELGRILSILPGAQQHQTNWSAGKLGEIVQRACELSIALMSHSKPEKRTVFALEHVAQLTLCSDVRYFYEFVKLLREDKRLTFTEVSDRIVSRRFEQISGMQHTYTIAANFQVIELLPADDKQTYIYNFKHLAKGVNLEWVSSDKSAPKEVFKSPRADYLIDLLAIIPKASSQLRFAKQLVVSFGDRSEYRPLTLQSLKRILAYLQNDQDKIAFVAYFKRQVPLLAEDVKAGFKHDDPIIRHVFNHGGNYPAFFDTNFDSIALPSELLPMLTREQSFGKLDDVSCQRNEVLKEYIDSVEGDLNVDRLAEPHVLKSLEHCEVILFSVQDKDEHQVGWPSGDLSWLAARAAHLFVAKLSHQPEHKKLDFALTHMRNVVWTDMSYLMKAIELLPMNDRLEFIYRSSHLPDNELANCKTPWSIVGVMEAVDLLPEEHKSRFIQLFKDKTRLIPWNELAQDHTELKSPRPEYLIGALYFIEQADARLRFAYKLLKKVNTSDYCYTQYKKLSPEALARILQALKVCSPERRQEYVKEFKKVVPMSVEEIQAVDAVASAQVVDAVASAQVVDAVASAQVVDGVASAQPVDGVASAQPVINITPLVPSVATPALQVKENESLRALFLYLKNLASPAAAPSLDLIMRRTQDGNYLMLMFTIEGNEFKPTQVTAAKNWFMKSIKCLACLDFISLDNSNFLCDSADRTFTPSYGYRFYLNLATLNQVLQALELKELDTLSGHLLGVVNNLNLSVIAPISPFHYVTQYQDALVDQAKIFRGLKDKLHRLEGTIINFGCVVNANTSSDSNDCGVWILLPPYDVDAVDVLHAAKAFGASVKVQKSTGLFGRQQLFTWLFIPEAVLIISKDEPIRNTISFDRIFTPDLKNINHQQIVSLPFNPPSDAHAAHKHS